MIELFSAEGKEMLLCSGSMWTSNVTNQHNTPGCLLWITQHTFLSLAQQTPVLILNPWSKKSTIKTSLCILKHCVHDLLTGKYLLGFRPWLWWSIFLFRGKSHQFIGSMLLSLNDYKAKKILWTLRYVLLDWYYSKI